MKNVKKGDKIWEKKHEKSEKVGSVLVRAQQDHPPPPQNCTKNQASHKGRTLAGEGEATEAL